MQNSNDQGHVNANLQINFPKSNEDHRLQLVEINGAIFAFLHSSLVSNGPINLHCKDWSLVLLAPIKSKADIVISAINIICLNEVKSEEGAVNIQASNRLVKLTPCIKPSEKVFAMGLRGEFQLDDDPGAFLNYFQLFNKIVRGAQDISPDSFSETQHNFILSLSALAAKIEGKTENLNIHRVLAIWDIPATIEG